MILKPETVVKYTNCGNHHVALSSEENAFGIYCATIGKIVPEIYDFDYSNKGVLYENLQSRVKIACELLQLIGENHVDKTNGHIKFYMEEFKQAYKNHPIIQSIADKVPYAIYLYAIENGFDVKHPHRMNNVIKNLDEPLEQAYGYLGQESFIDGIDKKFRHAEAYLGR